MKSSALKLRARTGAALAAGAASLVALAAPVTATAASTITVQVRAHDESTPFPHYWEQMFGSGRAALSLRESYRKDVRAVKAVTGFRYVRFHAIFHDELGLYDADANGQPVYNFSYIDQVYDGLLEAGIRPFVELSFMPQKMAGDPKGLFGFWYKPNVSPPKDYAAWDAMITAFARHLVERYGIEEVAQWYFEVWNEPNIGFWGGEPKQATYFELYDHTARALKTVDARLRVGGPSTAQAAWAADFIRHCKENNVPADFVSSHVYANDTSQDVFHNNTPIARDQMVCRAVRKVHDEIKSSAAPNLPLIWSEFNASFANEPNVTDTVYMGPWLAATISQCDGLAELMSYWSFSDVFEEGGVVKTTFYGGFGLIAADNIPKPAFNAFALLHKLGEERLPVDVDSALVTRRKDGALVVALWNYAPPDGTGAQYTAPGAPAAAKTFVVELLGVPKEAHVSMWRLDREHGNVVKTYDSLGRPAYPSRKQISELRLVGQLSPPETLSAKTGSLQIIVPAQGLALIDIH